MRFYFIIPLRLLTSQHKPFNSFEECSGLSLYRVSPLNTLDCLPELPYYLGYDFKTFCKNCVCWKGLIKSVHHLLGEGFLQQGRPELVPHGRASVNQPAIAGREEVIDQDLHPAPELPEPEPEQSGVDLPLRDGLTWGARDSCH